MTQIPTVYSFAEQLACGKRSESLLDAHFAPDFDIRPATMEQERRGIDRIFTDADGRSFTVQYKADEMAGQTGNLFIETISVNYAGVLGWAYSCEADWLMLYVPAWATIYALRPLTIRQYLYGWHNTFKLRAAANNEYHTYGLCVPRQAIENISARVITISPAEMAR